MKDFDEGQPDVHHPYGENRDRSTDPVAPRTEDRIRLGSIGRTISILDATTNPYLSQLMSEDICWRFAHEQWTGSRPTWWRRAERRRWEDEGRRLEGKRSRIRKLAADLGLRPAISTPTTCRMRVRRILRAILGF